VIRVPPLYMLTAIVLIVASVVSTSSNTFVLAQSGRSKPKPKAASTAEIKKLDAKVDEIHRSFLNDTASIIKGYEDAGQPERAKVLLEVLLKLDPKNEQIKKKIEALDEQVLESSEFDMDLDPGKAWQAVGAVAKDRAIRLVVEGEYKFSSSFSLGPEGVPTKDPANDLFGGAPLGSVVAVIIPPGANEGEKKDQKQPNPFNVGSKLEHNVKQDGMLLIKVNVPPGSKCTGKLKVKVSGVTKA